MAFSWKLPGLWKSEKPLQFFKQKAKNPYFEKATENGIMGSKTFWSTVKFFFSLKGFIHNIDITIVIDNKIIEGKSELAQTFKPIILT